MLTVTVSQINRYIKAVLEEDKKLTDLYVKGEISNFVHHYKSGHLYFSLKDQGGVIRAVMFKNDAELLPFNPENGMAVLVRARVGVYERDGAYQLYVSDIQPDGAGAMSVGFEQRKAKLAALGLFDEKNKKNVPSFPRRIGVITSETGAVLHDISSVLSRRYPLCTIVLSPAQVQGADTARSVIQALKRLEADGQCDLIIIARGGGSAEDLWGFNEEDLAFAIFKCSIPVISAVGHETDYTICDFVADMRAPTPSAAAELAAPDIAGLKTGVHEYWNQVQLLAKNRMIRLQQSLFMQKTRLDIKKPGAELKIYQEKLDFFANTLYNKKRMIIREKRRNLHETMTLLDSLSPFNVLRRGYALVYYENRPVQTLAQIKEGAEVEIQFADGKATAVIQAVTQEELS